MILIKKIFYVILIKRIQFIQVYKCQSLKKHQEEVFIGKMVLNMN